MSKSPSFVLDEKAEFYTIAPGNIITGKHLKYLNACLNSSIFYFALRKYYMGGGIEGELKTNRLLILEYIKLDRDKSTFKSHRDFSSEKEISFKHF